MLVKEADRDGIRLEIHTEECPPNPRTEFEPLAKMFCFSRKYILGDKHDYKGDHTLSEIESMITKDYKPVIMKLLRIYDHGGITISTRNQYPYNDYWDGGIVGFVFVSADDFKREYGRKTKKNLEACDKYLEGEVKEYDQYLRGEVYSYVVERFHKCGECGQEVVDERDSCTGFYGSDMKENGILESLPSYAKPLVDELEEVQ